MHRDAIDSLGTVEVVSGSAQAYSSWRVTRWVADVDGSRVVCWSDSLKLQQCRGLFVNAFAVGYAAALRMKVVRHWTHAPGNAAYFTCTLSVCATVGPSGPPNRLLCEA